MPSVSVSRHVAVAPADAERLWYDTAHWAQWVPGLDEVVAVDPGWPSRPGATVTWRSGPAGRGTVVERVIAHRPLAGQRLAVRDDTIEGEQRLELAPAADGVQLTLALRFRRHRSANPLSATVDLVFGRRAMADALAETLRRFAAAAES